MASIFTYNDDPPRVASPWSLAGRAPPSSAGPGSDLEVELKSRHGQSLGKDPAASRPPLDSITRLSAEPQTGPTEYKLHLLLRPRRTASNTASSPLKQGPRLRDRPLEEPLPQDSPPLASSTISRQHRLEQLTTQLLWRLQQSSPFNSATSSSLVLPMLPEASTELQPPEKPAKLVPGLEESKGALYEIGVADDGTFVGLTKDEMNESLNNLQAMASSLGCIMEVLRMVPINDLRSGSVGDSEADDFRADLLSLKEGVLYVAEAYIKPLLRRSTSQRPAGIERTGSAKRSLAGDYGAPASQQSVAQEQLRVTLTGATTCGKSSLLGTLSTSTLDNGRGLSRLNLLKHRHEIASGMTSSVAVELVGYRFSDDAHGPVDVVNYAAEDVASWNDIHAETETGRLVFLSDSAGHPRYRRTAVRGLVGCAPHWTMLCIAASENNDPATLSAALAADPDGRAFPGASAHLSMAHLDLCLKLRLPLIVVFTKVDAAAKAALRQMLSTLLTTLKAAGRKPMMINHDSRAVSEQDLQQVQQRDMAEIKERVALMGDAPHFHVPIVFTSALNGSGIGKMHALLRSLPVTHTEEEVNSPETTSGTADVDRPATLFHVDDVFDLDLARLPDTAGYSESSARGFIASGRLARGTITVGQTLQLGPFSISTATTSEEHDELPPSNPGDPFLTPRSFTDALAKVTSPSHSRVTAAEHEWRSVKVVSMRNLRLPVHVLQTDRVGTIGLVPLDVSSHAVQIRRGMVLAEKELTATHIMTAIFESTDASSLTVGSRVVIYCATIRSSAKVLAVALDTRAAATRRVSSGHDELTFGMEEDEPASEQDRCVTVTLQLDSYREYIEEGAQVLLMPGGGPGLHAGGDRGVKGLAGLEGFAGRVIDTFG